MITFEKWLEEKFDENDEIGGMPITKDNCEDMFDSWLQNLDVQELIDFGESYGKYVAKETTLNIIDELSKQTNK
jgi:hypothetical protein